MAESTERPAATAGIGRRVFAEDPARSRGRLFPEPPATRRTAFQRDRDRIVHSMAFRRLKGKTQVFLPEEGDHYRTRLTHTLEVAQIARSLAQALRLDQDLTEAIALAHDLGHSPFGHAGERALNAAMAPYGGFDHNAQSLRVVTVLERRYAEFDGLNLTWEVREGLAKHNGPLVAGDGTVRGGGELPRAVADQDSASDLWLWSYASAEAQIASVADDVAYDAHDLDDGMRAGLLDIDDLRVVPLLADLLDEVLRRYPAIGRSRIAPEVVRRLIGVLIEDVIAETERRLAGLDPQSADDVRRAADAVAAFSPPMSAVDGAIKALLFERVYRHPRVMATMEAAEELVEALYRRYWTDPQSLPADWRIAAPVADADRARHIADFLAGMTDRFAILEYRRLFDRLPDFV